MRKPLVSQRWPSPVPTALVLVSLLPSGPGLRAQVVDRHFQNTTYFGLGYVANVPNTFVGGSLLAVTPKLFGGAGVYADFKVSVNSPRRDPEFAPGVTVEQAELTYGDLEYDSRSVYLSANLGLVYALLPDFLLYGGAGYTKEDHYRHFYDDQEVRGQLGWYWVADPANSGSSVNLLGGAFFRLSRYVLFQAGVETHPRGATLGFTFVLPR